MSDLISRQAVKEWLGRWEGYLDTDMIARMQLKVDDIPTHETPSNTLGALDCVERQAAIDEIDEWIKAFRENGHKESAADACLIQDGIIQLPSAQPRKGKWIKENPYSGTYRYACSECHAHHRARYDFCPSCGADMREGGQNEND